MGDTGTGTWGSRELGGFIRREEESLKRRVPTDVNEIAELAIKDGILSRNEVEKILETTRKEIDIYCRRCAGVVAVCVDCGKCLYKHCKCDPCQHGKKRSEDCVFCLRSK